MDRGNERTRPSAGVLMVVGVLALAVFASGALLGRSTMRGEQQRALLGAVETDEVSVVVAARDLEMGVEIGSADVIVARAPPELVADQAFEALGEVVGRTPRTRILAREVVRRERLARRDAGAGLAAVVRPDMRAVSFRMESSAAVGGQLEPGDFVDVYLVPNSGELVGLEPTTATDVVLGVMVLSVSPSVAETTVGGPEADGGAIEHLEVTFELSPNSAELLVRTQDTHEIHLALRTDVDNFDFKQAGE